MASPNKVQLLRPIWKDQNPSPLLLQAQNPVEIASKIHGNELPGPYGDWHWSKLAGGCVTRLLGPSVCVAVADILLDVSCKPLLIILALGYPCGFVAAGVCKRLLAVDFLDHSSAEIFL